jgi:hypothetical protein
MSTRYDFLLMCNLRDDTPAQVIDTLKYMTRSEDYEFSNPPNGSFFKGDYWRNILRIPPEHQNMWTFTGDANTIFRRDVKWVQAGVTHYFWTLYIRRITSGDVQFEYMCFAHWLAQYSERVGFVGYIHSSYAIDEGTAPDLLYFVNGKLQIVSGSSGQVFTDTEHCDD